MKCRIYCPRSKYTYHECRGTALSFSTDTGIFCFTAAGLEVEVNDQQIQTEIIETEHKHVQAGSTAKQQGLHNYVLNIN